MDFCSIFFRKFYCLMSAIFIKKRFILKKTLYNRAMTRFNPQILQIFQPLAQRKLNRQTQKRLQLFKQRSEKRAKPTETA